MENAAKVLLLAFGRIPWRKVRMAGNALCGLLLMHAILAHIICIKSTFKKDLTYGK